MRRGIGLCILALTLATASPAHAGPRVGNGGGTWVCQEKSGPMRWMQLVDLFEAENEYGLTIRSAPLVDPWIVFGERMELIRRSVPNVAELLVLGADDLRNTVHIVPEKGSLTRIDDDEVRVRPRPESCEGGILYYGQIANFTDDGRLLIAGDLWNDPAFSVADRAALLMHEVIYKSLRDRFGDRTSSRARALVALLFSNLEAEEIDRRAAEVLSRIYGPADRPKVLQAPFRLVCEARLDAAESYARGEAISLEARAGARVTADLGQLSFAVETDLSTHEPIQLEISDQLSGAKATLGRRMMHAVFWKEARVALELEFTNAGQKASLTCEAQPR